MKGPSAKAHDAMAELTDQERRDVEAALNLVHGEDRAAGCRSGSRVDKLPGMGPARSRRAVDALSQPVGQVDQRSPAKRSFSGMAAPVASWTRTKVSKPINSPNLSLPILRKKMFSP